jgi:hypothetical protein
LIRDRARRVPMLATHRKQGSRVCAASVLQLANTRTRRLLLLGERQPARPMTLLSLRTSTDHVESSRMAVVGDCLAE